MFKNAAKKLQTLCIIIVVFSVIIGAYRGAIVIYSLPISEDFVVLGIIFGGCLGFFIGWASTLFLYAFSELCIDVANLNNRVIEDSDGDNDDDDE